jgi:ATP-dependent DNA helicase RecG
MAASSEIGSLEWDRAPLVDIEEMQSNYVTSFFSKRKELRGKEVKTPDRIRCLKSLGAIKDNKLTNAGVLFFAQTNEHLPQAKIRIVKMDGDEPKWSKEYEGPIWKIVESAYEDLLKEVNKLEIVVGTKRRILGPFPPRVLREAIINAAVHRNYVIGSDIRIFLEDNSISIRNPGGLLPGVSLDDPEHVPRNPSLCNLMYEIGMIERYGYGIRMMRKEIENLKGFRLDFKVTPNRFEVIIERSVSLNLDQLDTKILGLLNEELRSGDLSKRTGSTKPTIIAHLKKLEQLGLIEKKGAGPQTKYRIK